MLVFLAACAAHPDSPQVAASAPRALRAVPHPMDGLTAQEYATVKRIVTEKVNGKVAFPLIDLEEPPKAEVLAWTPGAGFSRRARAVVRTEAGNFEARIDLATAALLDWQPATGEPMILFSEFVGATEAALSHPEMVAGLRRRGLQPEEVYCLPLTAGNFFDGETDGKRLMKAPCFMLPGEGSNWFARPVEGLFATVDLSTMSVVNVYDSGSVPIATDLWGYTEKEIGQRMPLREIRPPEAIAPPDSIAIRGSWVDWDMWRFHLRTEKRAGLVLSNVEVGPAERRRSVLYQAHLSEVFVPYMDPDGAFFWRTYMDSGEYGFGLFLSPLRPGTDCPSRARFLSGQVHTDAGDPLELPNAICIFERQTGDAAWRHFECSPRARTPLSPQRVGPGPSWWSEALRRLVTTITSSTMCSNRTEKFE